MVARTVAPIEASTDNLEMYVNMRGPGKRLRRWFFHAKTSVVAVLVIGSLCFAVGAIGWATTQSNPEQLKPWAPISADYKESIGCVNVIVSGRCLGREVVPTQEYPGAPAVMQNLPVLHVPRGGPFPAVPVTAERSASETVNTHIESWQQSVLPLDGTYDHIPTITYQLIGGGPISSVVQRPIYAEQQARVLELDRQGMSVTVWAIKGTQTPSDPPPKGYYPASLDWGSDLYAIVYGG
jgi:hypothetical protein